MLKQERMNYMLESSTYLNLYNIKRQHTTYSLNNNLTTSLKG